MVEERQYSVVHLPRHVQLGLRHLFRGDAPLLRGEGPGFRVQGPENDRMSGIGLPPPPGCPIRPRFFGRVGGGSQFGLMPRTTAVSRGEKCRSKHRVVLASSSHPSRKEQGRVTDGAPDPWRLSYPPTTLPDNCSLLNTSWFPSGHLTVAFSLVPDSFLSPGPSPLSLLPTSYFLLPAFLKGTNHASL